MSLHDPSTVKFGTGAGDRASEIEHRELVSAIFRPTH